MAAEWHAGGGANDRPGRWWGPSCAHRHRRPRAPDEVHPAGKYEEVRTQQESLRAGHERTEAERERYQALFLLAPAAYLVTDPVGLIREANLRAVTLLGVDCRFVVGKPLVSFVHAEDRWPFRDRLAREDMAEWRVRLHPRGGEPIPVTVSVAVGRDRSGTVQQLRWLLWPPPEVELGPVLTATGDAERAFEWAQRDLDEGPCVDAFRKSEVVRSSDLRADPRWPRLAPAVAGNQIRGVLSSPVQHGGVVLGTCNAVTHAPAAGPTPTTPPSSPSAPCSAGCWHRPSRPGTRATWSPSSRSRWSRACWSSRPRAC
jgi:PAS domain S-box-containing protein